MYTPDIIHDPERESDLPGNLVREELRANLIMAKPIEFTGIWNISNTANNDNSSQKHDPNLLSSWLLKTGGNDTDEVLKYPFALLELTKEKDKKIDEEDSTNTYGFRLVSLEEMSGPYDELTRLTQFKLIAGCYSFKRSSDEFALYSLALALRGFALGELKLNENDHKKWEERFYDRSDDIEQA